MTAAEKEARRGLLVRAARRMESAGINWSKWARLHGFRKHSVMKVVRGERACVRGECYRIAEALLQGAFRPMPEVLRVAAALADAARDATELLDALEKLSHLGLVAVTAVKADRVEEWGMALDRARSLARRVRGGNQ